MPLRNRTSRSIIEDDEIGRKGPHKRDGAANCATELQQLLSWGAERVLRPLSSHLAFCDGRPPQGVLLSASFLSSPTVSGDWFLWPICVWKHSVMGIALGLGMERICTTPPSPRFLGGISRLPQLCCVSVSGTRCFFFGDIIGTRGRIMHIGHDTRRLFFLGNTESRQLGRVVTCGLGYNSQPSGPPLFQFMVWLHLLFCHFFIGCLRRG